MNKTPVELHLLFDPANVDALPATRIIAQTDRQESVLWYKADIVLAALRAHEEVQAA